MEIRVLKYFLAVAREGSITKAAEILHLSQPTLSRQLMDMEEMYGKKLFIRGSRHISLTEDGLLLRKRAEEIIDLVDKTELEMTSPTNAISGNVIIGAGETETLRPIIKLAKSMKKDFPNVTYQLFSGIIGDVIEKLDNGLIDFGLVIGPIDTKKYNYIKLKTTDRYGIVMRKDSPLASKKYVEAKDLWDKPLMVTRQPNMLKKRGFTSWIKKDLNDLNIVATYNLIFNAAIMVEEGFGYALSMDNLINKTNNDNICFRPFKPEFRVEIFVIWKKYQIFSKAANEFLKRMQKEFG